MAILLIDRKYALCGKEFGTHEEYAYKVINKNNHYLYFCSWKCLQKYRQQKENAKKDRKRVGGRDREEKTSEIIKAIIQGVPNDQLVKQFGVTRRSIYSIRTRYRELIKAATEGKAG